MNEAKQKVNIELIIVMVLLTLLSPLINLLGYKMPLVYFASLLAVPLYYYVSKKEKIPLKLKKFYLIWIVLIGVIVASSIFSTFRIFNYFL